MSTAPAGLGSARLGSLFTQQPVGTDIWIALAWCVGILIVAYIFVMVIYRRRIS
jgi:ABC-2 type transport system permease protein